MTTLSERWAAARAARKQTTDPSPLAALDAAMQLSRRSSGQATDTALDVRVKELQRTDKLDYATALSRAERELSGAPPEGVTGTAGEGVVRSLRTGAVVEIPAWHEPKVLTRRGPIKLSRTMGNDVCPIRL